MSTTHMNYHHIKTTTLKRKTNRTHDCDGTEYGVLELELVDRDGNDHTIVIFTDEPFPSSDLEDEPVVL